MWLPPTLKAREFEMRGMGLRIPVEQLYNSDGTGLNNAVVLFGKGCTGELISREGLVLTNHHCGYGTVQGLVTRTNDYFAAGFWAMNNGEELPCPGLTVTFIRKMENVTDKITYGLPDTMSDARREAIISVRIKGLEKGYRTATGMDAVIQPYYRGNQYWVTVTETYKDIRLVGFPPNGIGNFGGDTDNWMWPRHNADFSLFRVYADKDGKPAPYAGNNKPYKPKNFFKINISGYKEGDFTMVYGFPGATQEYITGSQLNQIYKISDPIRVDIRTRRLALWKKAMSADRDVFLKYTSKSAGIANAWKKWQGEIRGLRINDVPSKKAAYEKGFIAWASYDTSAPYADGLLAKMQAATEGVNAAQKAEEYIKEAVLGIELIAQGAELDKLLQTMRRERLNGDFAGKMGESKAAWTAFFKNYSPELDREVFEELMPMFIKACPEYVPALYRAMLAASRSNYRKWSANAFGTSLVASEIRFNNFLSGITPSDTARILSDPSWQMWHAIATLRDERLLPRLLTYNTRITYYNRLYMAAQMNKDEGSRSFYPDANLTLRLTYGRIKGIDPDGPAGYGFQTALGEVIAKDQPEVEEFRVPEKLKQLYASKDFGRWGINGSVPVAFIADNHTSGGNSGSPVLNGKGELIGTNFDRIWEGTMSDLYFDPALCRNISVDIRYTLFLIEKFGGAGWLLNEMQLQKG